MTKEEQRNAFAAGYFTINERIQMLARACFFQRAGGSLEVVSKTSTQVLTKQSWNVNPS